MKYTITLFSFMLFAIPGQAQHDTEQDPVKRALLDYIEGFYEGDTSKIIRSIATNAVKYGYWKDPQTGKYTGEPMSYREMIDYAACVKKRNKPASPAAVKKTDVYDVQDQTASGKVTAWWGTDYILLEKANGKWMIRMVLWQGPLKS